MNADMVKLSKLNTNFGVPAMYRIIVWKLLMGECAAAA